MFRNYQLLHSEHHSPHPSIYRHELDLKPHYNGHYWTFQPNQSIEGQIIRKNKVSQKYLVNIDENGFRKTPDIQNPKKGAVLFFGGSFDFGKGLNDDETLPWLISTATKRKTYNAAVYGMGLQNMIMSLKDPSFYEKVPNTEVIIYSFMPWHMDNIKNKDYGKVSLHNDELLVSPPGVDNDNVRMGRDKVEKTFYLLMIESHHLARKNYPNSRFVLIYPGGCISPFVLKKLNDDNIETVNLDKLLLEPFEQPKFQIKGDPKHFPNAYIWKELTPYLVYRLNL